MLIWVSLLKKEWVGISYIAKGYGKANNKYVKSNDPYKLSIYILYLDAKNLYG